MFFLYFWIFLFSSLSFSAFANCNFSLEIENFSNLPTEVIRHELKLKIEEGVNQSLHFHGQEEVCSAIDEQIRVIVGETESRWRDTVEMQVHLNEGYSFSVDLRGYRGINQEPRYRITHTFSLELSRLLWQRENNESNRIREQRQSEDIRRESNSMSYSSYRQFPQRTYQSLTEDLFLAFENTSLGSVEIFLPERRLQRNRPMTRAEEDQFFTRASFTNVVHAVQESLRMIPDHFLKKAKTNLKKIKMTAEPHPSSGHRYAGSMDNGNNKLRIKIGPSMGTRVGMHSIRNTLIHEIGHALHFSLPIDVQILFYNLSWDTTQRVSRSVNSNGFLLFEIPLRRSNFVTNYARTNAFEDFAETFEAYILSPSNLRNFPKKLEYFSHLDHCLELEFSNLSPCMQERTVLMNMI